MIMANGRRYQLETNEHEDFTPEEKAAGYHFCAEWDYMVVGPDDPEWECCLCHDGRYKEV